MSKRQQSRQVQVEGIGSFLQLHQPQMKERKDKKTGVVSQVAVYGMDLLKISPEDEKKLRELAIEVAVEEWGQDTSKWPTFRYKAVRDAGEKAVDQSGKPRLGYVAGEKFINPTSTFRPPIVDYPGCQEILDPAVCYGGARFRIQVNAYVYNYMGNIGVKFGLVAVQKIADGEPFGMGRPDPTKIFKKPDQPAGTPAGAPGRNLL